MSLWSYGAKSFEVFISWCQVLAHKAYFLAWARVTAWSERGSKRTQDGDVASDSASVSSRTIQTPLPDDLDAGTVVFMMMTYIIPDSQGSRQWDGCDDTPIVEPDCKMDSETGLRNPMILEAQSADKTLMIWSWREVGRLTIHSSELRSIHFCKPGRVFLDRLIKSWNPVHPKGVARPSGPVLIPKDNRAKGKSTGKTSGKVTWITEAMINGNKKQLCMRYQTGKRDMGNNCWFHHGCAFPTSTGEACNKSHGALMHDKTPHWQNDAVSSEGSFIMEHITPEVLPEDSISLQVGAKSGPVEGILPGASDQVSPKFHWPARASDASVAIDIIPQHP